jgi:UDP-N-acetylglucosamine 2-epimerase (non-hydrolysing)
MRKKIKVLLVAGARPNFMKVSPVYNELKRHRRFRPMLVHTGQHYDREMSQVFFKNLKMPRPDVYLGIGSASHGRQTGGIMIAFEEVCLREKPDLVIVVGDVNSTLACALVAAKLMIPVAHVEAGLRSFDRSMPEEINRLLTDHVSDFLFTTCLDGNRNLLREGIAKKKIFFVGNTMIDSMQKHLTAAKKSQIRQRLGLNKTCYGLVTLHRPSNVDDQKTLQHIFDALSEISKRMPVVFPVHPRTEKQLGGIHFMTYDGEQKRGMILTPALGYLDFLYLMQHATLVLTDSGGIQEETTILGIPCLTIRDNTERPITIRQGTNVIVGNDPGKIVKEAQKVLQRVTERRLKSKLKKPKYWDGRAAERIIGVLAKEYRHKYMT